MKVTIYHTFVASMEFDIQDGLLDSELRDKIVELCDEFGLEEAVWDHTCAIDSESDTEVYSS